MASHKDYIHERIRRFKQRIAKQEDMKIQGSHDSIIKNFSSCVFTNFTRDAFSKSYVLKHSCSDCGKRAEQRCHGKGEERPVLIRRALERIYPDTTQLLSLHALKIAYLEEHVDTSFTFKCKQCHDKETYHSKQQ
jgi:hypothetical protein